MVKTSKYDSLITEELQYRKVRFYQVLHEGMQLKHRFRICQGRISIASPYEKKRYRFSTAWRYAESVRSYPAKAQTSIKREDSGK